MSNVIRIFNRAGTELTEIEARARRSWILNDEGDCFFTLAIRDSKAKEELLQYGNLVLIEHDELPDWAGVIDLDPAERVWRGGSLDVSAYSLERLLKSSDSPILKVTGTAGSIFRQVIDVYNMEAESIMLPGEIWLGGTQREETLGDSCFTHVKRVSERANNDWNISHRLEGGKFKLYANYYEQRGAKTERLLYDGKEGNIEKVDTALSEAGPIYNIITGYSDASTTGTRQKVTLRNEESIEIFGPRRNSLTFSGVTELATLTKNTQSTLDNYAYPYKQAGLTVLNKGNIFGTLEVGNVLDLRLSKSGFLGGALGYEAEVKIISMQYSGTPDKVALGVRTV